MLCTLTVHSDRQIYEQFLQLTVRLGLRLHLLFVCFLSVIISATLFLCCLFCCVRFNFFSTKATEDYQNCSVLYYV